MDTNKVLRKLGYGIRHDFGEIARIAAGREWANEEELARWTEETYCAVKSKPGLLAKRKPYKLFQAFDLPLDDGAVDQLHTALSLPVAIRGAGMPDLHRGYSLPIGGVVVLDHAISPAFVGYDIGCQMKLSFLDGIDPEILDDEKNRNEFLQALLRSTSFGVGAESGADHPVMDEPGWNEIRFLKQNKELASKQLGSSGAGNHFADIVTGTILVENDFYPQGSKFVALMTHSGSRGIGNRVGHYYAELADQETQRQFNIPKGYGWFDLSGGLGMEYSAAMNLMVRYAAANHDIVHERFINRIAVHSSVSVRNFHNFAVVEENSEVIHRKGATPAGKGVLGIIPGSSGTPSYLVKGKGNEDGIRSASHGAGRPHSRTRAKELYNQAEFQNHMAARSITYHGVASDETFAAYKPIQSVMAAQSELVEIIAEMYPRVVVMGGLVASDDGD